MRLTGVATYHRTVRASLARVRENVLDWEHLPGRNLDGRALRLETGSG